MFDKIFFNKTAYDRSVSTSGLQATLNGSGNISLGLILQTPLPINTLAGSSGLSPGLVLRANMEAVLSGNGGIQDTTQLVLKTPISAAINGSGDVLVNATIKTPLPTVSLVGNGDMVTSDSSVVLQNPLPSTLGGSGGIQTSMVFASPLPIIAINGSGSLSGSLLLPLDLNINIGGEGSVVLRRINEMNESFIELVDITLAPGETVTIDTDLLSVMFGNREDVDCITSDSAIGLELAPGDNIVSISSDTNQELSVTAIWQNRWL